MVVSGTLFSGNGNNTQDYAIYASGASTILTVAESTIRDNAGKGIGVANNARATVRHSRVHDNASYQVYNTSATPPDARFNWWGQSPPDAGFFYGNVIYDPWIVTGTFASGYFVLAEDPYEPDDTFAQAAPLDGVNTTFAAFLDPLGDADVYRLDVGEGSHPSTGSGQVLLAIADATGTPLALQVSLYDVNETLLDTATGAAGEAVTVTTPVSPGLYYIRVDGAGSIPVSHRPYHLTLLQADSRTDLVAQTVGEGGRTYDFGDPSTGSGQAFAINLNPGASTTITATAPPSLTVPGGYYLRGRLTNGRDQVLADALSTFFLSDIPLALTLGTDQAAYRPGQAVTVTGQVHNTGDAAIGPETLTLAQDGSGFYTETVTLPAHSVHDFSATTTAPTVTGQFTLTGQVNDTIVVAVVPVAAPEVDVTLDAPDVVLPGDFITELTLANNGQVPVTLQVDFHGQPHAPSLQPGDLVVYSRTLALTRTTDLAVQITDDLTETVTHTVGFSAAPDLAFSPDDPQYEGDVEIPYTLVNSGTVDLVAQVTFDLAEAEPFRTRISGIGGSMQHAILRSDLPALQRQGIAWLASQQVTANGTTVVRTHTLPAGDVVTDTLVVSLTRGLRPVQATLRVDEPHNPGLFSHSLADAWEETEGLTLTVQGDNDLQLATCGAPTVTVVITNVGWNAFSGTLRTVGRREEVFSSLEQVIHVPVGQVGNLSYYTATVDTSDLSPGPYTVTLEVWAENGILVKSTAITGAVPAPDFVVTQVPTQTTLFSDQVVTLTFGVENQGEAPDLASFHFTLGDLEEETQKQWIEAEAMALFTFTTYLPLDMPTMDVLATCAVTSTHDPAGDAGDMLFHIEGISLTVETSTDQPFYVEGDPVTVTLTITNAGTRDTDDLTALMAFNGITQTQVFSLTPGAHIALTFPYTATFRGDRKVFYGLYGHFADRGAYLNTLYIYRRNLGATLTLDEEVYLPGQTVSATLVTTLTQGTLTAYVFGGTYTLTIGSDPGFSFVVPADTERGSHALYYVVHGCGCEADGREQATWFDVAAPWVRVIESRLGEGPYEPGDVVSATLTVAVDAAQDTEIRAWLLYPDGSEGQEYRQTVHLAASLNNQVVITAVITDTQMGLHQLLYRLAPVGQVANLPYILAAEEEGAPQADGAEGFDAGPAGLDRVTTDEESYANTGDPVRALLDIYSEEGGPAEVVITLDDGPATTQPVTLTAGYQTVTTTLTAPILPGRRTLTATLLMNGYWVARQTGFDYGISLPDLRPGAPWVAPGGKITRTLAAPVSNDGEGAAITTTARFTQDGTFIGMAAVPALEAGEQAVVLVVWDVQGQGGEHTLYITVDPVTEFDEKNNTAQADVTLPRLDTGLAVEPGSILAGEPVTLTTYLENLQGVATLPVTATVEMRSPLGTVVYSQTWTLTLGGGEEKWLDDVWQSGVDAVLGVYAVMQEAEDAYGEQQVQATSFTVAVREERPEKRVYLPVVLRNYSPAAAYRLYLPLVLR